METKPLHIGQFLRDLAEKNGMKAPEIGEKISMSAQGVREIFRKDQVHQKNIEDFTKLFEVNIYEILSSIWQGKPYQAPEEGSPTVAEEPARYSPQKASPITVTFTVDSRKKDKLIELLLH